MRFHGLRIGMMLGMAFLQLAMPLGVGASKGVAGSPRVLALFFGWNVTSEDVSKLSRFDVVVLDSDQQVLNPDKIRELHRLNPGMKILAYVASEDLSQARFSEPITYPMGKLASQVQDTWYLHDPAGERTWFWRGYPIMNVTDLGPQSSNGLRWNTVLPKFIHDEILSTGLWDGVFLDNVFNGISHFAHGPVDLDRDGQAEPPAVADAAWQVGMRKLLRNMANENPGVIIMGNGGTAYADQLQGILFENFPVSGWPSDWKDVRTVLSKNVQPSYTAINVNTGYGGPSDTRVMRYGLGAALIAGSYYSFDDGIHSTAWWYDEFETPLGKPRAPGRVMVPARSGTDSSLTVWGRDFQNGLALANAGDAPQTVRLPGVFEKIRGTQDARVNDGSIVSTIRLEAHDGLILLRREETSQVVGTAFTNGSFLRAFHANGQQLQNGFFAQRTDVPSGVLTLVADLDRDGTDDVITAIRGKIAIQFGNGKQSSFFPFGNRFSGSLSIAAGNANRDPSLELIVGRDGAAPPTVKVFSMAGKELASWDAYVSRFTGGARVAIGDIDGDGRREVVTGAGPGGGPHIRIWKTDGTVWGGGFFAFNQTERGGVSVSIGDMDGDGKDEIVVGSGRGSIPRVRVYDGRGMLKTEITLGTKPLSGGLEVGAADLDGDHRAEILVGGVSAF